MNNDLDLFSRLAAPFPAGVETLASPIVLRRYPDGGAPREKCVAALGRDGNEIVLRTAAYDSLARNMAAADNMEMWLLGDVVEFFMQPAGREDYYEFHVTPEGRRLQLHLPDYISHRGIDFEDKLVDVGLAVESRLEAGGVWISEMRVPMGAVGMEATAGMRFAVCRYNYGENGSEPELSCSFAATEKFGFHNPPAWSVLA